MSCVIFNIANILQLNHFQQQSILSVSSETNFNGIIFFNSDLTEKCVVHVSVRIKELLQPMIDVAVSKMQLSGWVNKFGDKVADDVSTYL